MSPASQGGVEVERYIGSCLISSTVRPGSHKPIVAKKQESVIRGKTRGCYGGQNFPNNTEQCQVQYGPGGWTGAPLISMISSPRRCNQRSSPPPLGQQQQQQQPQSQLPPPQPTQQQQGCEQQVSAHLHKNPLSRLAIHTQGAPLILSSRFHNRGKIHNSGNANGITNTVCSNNGTVNSYVHNNGNTVTSNCTMNSCTVRCPPSRPQRSMELAKKQQTNPKSPDCSTSKEVTGTGSNIANIDSLSIASDESSGSNNSENSLPRIIKPRKRRKKDRKPANNAMTAVEVTKHEEQQQQSSPSLTTEQSNVVSLKPYVPACYEQHYEAAVPLHLRNHRRPPIARESMYGCSVQTTGMSVQEIADARQRYPHRHVEVKVLDDNRNVVVPAQLRTILPKGYRHSSQHRHTSSNNVPRYMHEYNDSTTTTTTTTTASSTTTSCEDGIKDGLGSCQCQYCDPSALIWDVDQNCYSPFLTPSPSTEFCSGHHFSKMPLFLPRPGLNCQEQRIERLFNTDNPPLHQERDTCSSTGVVLRRSWSDPTSYFSEEISTPSKDVGVIGDRGQAESGKRRTLWRGDSIGIPTNNVGSSGTDVNSTVQSPKGLEVSTEIITSPNGHRDLEIKFYSPSPNAPAPEEDKRILAEDIDEDEDFSDIWSYHESKLQQDFRTLLQAEE
ncbi:hypothetical protein WH47_01692 [Habropoda laboriosa]|uniref:Uncharacterized protein n=1 Tax=Habropoda laboriosa TaxID=597456 RepID=A0A0L7QZS7_9HYME|nr:PREDICTED: transcription factor mef2A-like [Habropoda laboriosa]KOC64124.1 hypothetical protein WH47_01692 [Habropoda laboriosa]